MMAIQTFRMLAAATLLAAAPAGAFAQSVSIQSISIGEELQDKSDDYGPRELARLETALQRDLERAFERAGLVDGAETLSIAVVIEDAWPNRPTMGQMAAEPSLSYSSLSRGGADVVAVIYDAAGEQVAEIAYDWRIFDITDSRYASTWTDANRTFERFARRVVDRVRELQAGA